MSNLQRTALGNLEEPTGSKNPQRLAKSSVSPPMQTTPSITNHNQPLSTNNTTTPSNNTNLTSSPLPNNTSTHSPTATTDTSSAQNSTNNTNPAHTSLSTSQSTPLQTTPPNIRADNSSSSASIPPLNFVKVCRTAPSSDAMVPSLIKTSNQDKRPSFQNPKKLFANYEWFKTNLQGQIRIADADPAFKLTDSNKIKKLFNDFFDTITKKHPDLIINKLSHFKFVSNLKTVQGAAGNYVKVDVSFPFVYTQLQQDLVFAELGVLAHQTENYKVTVKLPSSYTQLIILKISFPSCAHFLLSDLFPGLERYGTLIDYWSNPSSFSCFTSPDTLSDHYVIMDLTHGLLPPKKVIFHEGLEAHEVYMQINSNLKYCHYCRDTLHVKDTCPLAGKQCNNCTLPHKHSYLQCPAIDDNKKTEAFSRLSRMNQRLHYQRQCRLKRVAPWLARAAGELMSQENTELTGQTPHPPAPSEEQHQPHHHHDDQPQQMSGDDRHDEHPDADLEYPSDEENYQSTGTSTDNNEHRPPNTNQTTTDNGGMDLDEDAHQPLLASDSEDGMDTDPDDEDYVPESRGRQANNASYSTGAFKPKLSELEALQQEQKEFDLGLLKVPHQDRL
ncbi:unnamed protein product [Ambrosiozyma monospora]|uniref:Unnamed protein product n=1 Tax=Ambrosiozyma monospora TaxID=43982 RepID=A0A9W6Z1M6_AMBMO|nr:unnamed protein product [Ambrosiozyma monospora]